MQAWGYPTQLLTAADVQRLEPQLPTPGLLVASHTAIEGHVNTGQVVDGCLRALTAAGAEICIGMPVTGLTMTRTTDGRLVQTVEIGEQAIPCDVVVLAGGAAMPALARMAGVVLPLYDTFGATLLTKPLPPLFQTIALLHSPRDRQPLVNVRQFPDGAVMIQGNGHSNYDMATGATRTQRRRRFWPRPPPLCRAYRAPNFKKFGAAAGRFRKMAKPFSALRPK